jgi:cytochrome c553
LLRLALLIVIAVFLAAASPATRPADPADNSYCITCHLNLAAEKLTTQHEKAGIGCDTCHGPSSKHSSDEDGLTAPDVMFPKDRIVAACASCHKTDALGRDKAHAPLLGNTAAAPFQVCTDCHGQHAMKQRTRRWDKITHKLISDDGVRMVGGHADPGKK